jgi:hypothetical protein
MNNKLNFGYKRRTLLYVGLISFIFSFNLFFNIFVWYPYDLSPNQAIGFVSLLFILWIIWNWNKDKKELTQKLKDLEMKG